MNIIKTKEYLQCSSCNKRYDLLCANVTDKIFKSMKIADKAVLKCQDCRSKLPKTNNTDTPVRTTRIESPKNSTKSPQQNRESPTCSKITIRSKRQPISPASSLEDDTAFSANTSLQHRNSPIDSHSIVCSKRLESSPMNPIADDTVLEMTKSSLREIIKQEISSAIKEVVTEQLKQISDLISDFRASLDFYNEKHEEMRVTLEQTPSRVQILERDSKLQTSVHELTKRINLMEQHNRSTNIELQNVPENRSENLITTVLQLGKITKCQIEEAAIAHCTRIAKKDTKTSRPRSILVKFNTPRQRDTFLAAAINFNKTNATNKLNTSHLGIAAENPIPIYIVEHLSADNKALHAAARLRGKDLGYKFVWVRNGRIFMKKNDLSERIVITSQEVLNSVT